jgi:hypothetical protein
MARKDYNSTKTISILTNEKATPKWKELFEISSDENEREVFGSCWKVG